jgi:hypothetical protein
MVSPGGLLVPDGISHQLVSIPSLTSFIRYIYYWNLQFLNNEIIIKTKVLFPQSRITFSDFGCAFWLVFLLSKSFGFSIYIVWRWTWWSFLQLHVVCTNWDVSVFINSLNKCVDIHFGKSGSSIHSLNVNNAVYHYDILYEVSQSDLTVIYNLKQYWHIQLVLRLTILQISSKYLLFTNLKKKCHWFTLPPLSFAFWLVYVRCRVHYDIFSIVRSPTQRPHRFSLSRGVRRRNFFQRTSLKSLG